MISEERIAELEAENEYLKSVVDGYRNREKEIEEAEKKASENAERIIRSAEKIFDMEADRLRLFKLAWDRKFAALSANDKNRLEALNALAFRIDEAISKRGRYAALSTAEITAEMRRMVDEKGNLVQSEGIFVGEGEEGFSLDDILNPKEDLDLESLCKEMGLMED
ncbi:MAG: hypothetical protein IJ800_05350 [Clostridia bacterium]|nr:hypothetical protein [Clostridia bacterium]